MCCRTNGPAAHTDGRTTWSQEFHTFGSYPHTAGPRLPHDLIFFSSDCSLSLSTLPVTAAAPSLSPVAHATPPTPPRSSSRPFAGMGRRPGHGSVGRCGATAARGETSSTPLWARLGHQINGRRPSSRPPAPPLLRRHLALSPPAHPTRGRHPFQRGSSPTTHKAMGYGIAMVSTWFVGDHTRTPSATQQQPTAR